MRARHVYESINFKRGKDPKETLRMGRLDNLYKKREWQNMSQDIENDKYLWDEIQKLLPGEPIYWLSYGDADELTLDIHDYINEELNLKQVSEVEEAIDIDNNMDHGTLALFETEDGIPFITHFDGHHDSNWLSNREGAQLIFAKFQQALDIDNLED